MPSPRTATGSLARGPRWITGGMVAPLEVVALPAIFTFNWAETIVVNIAQVDNDLGNSMRRLDAAGRNREVQERDEKERNREQRNADGRAGGEILKKVHDR